MKVKSKILIVDDKVENLIALEKILSGKHWELIRATSGNEALTKALEHDFAVVISDVQMPEMDGFEMVELLHQNPGTRLLPVIFVSAIYSGNKHLIKGIETGAVDFIIKPIVPEILKGKVTVFLDLYEQKMELKKEIERRRKSEKKLKKSEARYRALFEESKDAIYIRNKDGKFIDINKFMLELFGYKKDEMKRMSLNDLYADPKEMERFEQEIERKGYVMDFEVKFHKKDGTEIFCIATSNVLRGDDEAVEGDQGMIRDITDSKNNIEMLRKTMNGIIQAMTLTVEAKDPYTAGHQRRVANLARAIATEMSLPKNQIEGIRLAGIVHDIGKINVPTEILCKPGKIDNVEFNLIKAHSKVGFDIIKTIDFPWPIAQIVYQHHERIDGTGYPEGIYGDDILIEAKIIGVADVVEAMASDRPYRAALGIDVALDEISKKRGIIFNADAVDACIRLFREKDFNLGVDLQ